jgi:hypothetical protein
MECIYHKTLDKLFRVLWQHIETNYDAFASVPPHANMFDLWIEMDAELDYHYKETFETFVEELTEEQATLIENKGRNLQRNIYRLLNKWKNKHPEVQHQIMPKLCLKSKIYEYIFNQFNKPDLKAIIECSC